MTFMEGLLNIKVIVVQSKLNVYSTMNIIISTLSKGSINVCMLCGIYIQINTYENRIS